MKRMFLKNIFCSFLLVQSLVCFSCSNPSDAYEVSGSTNAIGRKITVSTVVEFNSLKPVAGDTIVLKNGEWKEALINLKGKGTAQNRIILMAETMGKVVFTGNSNLKIDGEWLWVEGLLFTNGFSLKDDIVVFTKNSKHCCLSQSAIINYNPPSKETDYKWVSLYGTKNRVEYCEFTGKTHQGTTLVVWLDEQPNYHEIANNYFGPRPTLGGNGGETIRIGTSQWSMHDSYTNVSKNIFDKCDGEIEVVSVKSCHNTIADNLFYECDGTLTLRHGNNNIIDANYFIGNNKPNTGGIRVIGEGHLIRNNYLYLLSGKNLRAAISIMNAFANPQLNEYWQVKNVVVSENTIVQCEQAFVVGAGKNTTRTLPPDSLAIVANNILFPQKLLIKEDEPTRFIVKDNLVRGAALIPGFEMMPNDMIKKDSNGIWQIKSNKKAPFWFTETVGPAWRSNKPTIRIL